jgi:type IV secretory pathway TrbL component
MTIFADVLLVLAAVVLFALLAGLPVYFLWNWLMPVLFSLPEVTFWQALGLCLLSGFLFKNGQSSSK